MQATAGDTLVMHANHTGEADRSAEILEVRGKDGAPPFLVRYEDGHQALVFPGPDATVHHRATS
jgi:hypothetical protein